MLCASSVCKEPSLKKVQQYSCHFSNGVKMITYVKVKTSESYANIYKRIIAFLVILILLIALIYYVHPAFRLAYSPMVVILAFFILLLICAYYLI